MKEDIIKWAREAGFMFCEESYKHQPNCLFYGGYAVDTQLERFAALVAAAERNKVAQWMMAKGYATGHGDTVEDLLRELEWQIAENWTRGMVNGVQTEREACAKVCDRMAARSNDIRAAALESAAENIRARGQE
jgi:hypothetical protein